MRMKKLAASMLSAGLIMSLGTESLMASTEEGKLKPESSEVEVEFTEPETVKVKIYDPIKPGLENTIDEKTAKESGNVTGQTGPLSLNYVTNLNFGSTEIDVTKTEYVFPALNNHSLQVTDSRGSGEGWHVTAKLNEFKNSDAEGKDEKVTTLKSAEINFLNGSAVTPNAQHTEYNPEVNEDFTLEAGKGAQKVVNAEEGKGQGAWLTRWLKEDDGENKPEITLAVPAKSASAGKHKTTITWTLENGPYQGNQSDQGDKSDEEDDDLPATEKDR